MKKIYLIVAFMIPVISFAQMQATGNLTVFSEDGDKFYLVLNGEKQNDIAQSNIRIEELPQPYYSAKILFADSTIAPIMKKNLMITDADGKMMDVTYRIRKDKSNKAKLNAYSAIEVQQDFNPPSGMYVRRCGQSNSGNQNGGYSQTTTTTSNTNVLGATVNAPGLNVSINISDPIDMHTSTTTTTTTTSSSNSNSNSNQNTQNNTSNSNCNGWPMKAADFSAAKKTITDGSFDETKLSTAKSIAASNCLSSDQVVQVCNLFSFEETKLAFAKFAFKYTTDPKNYFKVNNVFSFSTSKEELNQFIGVD
jgi:hypothetical protein